MTVDDLEGIFDADGHSGSMEKDCWAFLGLLLMRKYLPVAGILGAEHDIIYSIEA